MEKDTLHAIMDAIGHTSIAECEIVAKNGSIRILRKPGLQVPRLRDDVKPDGNGGAESGSPNLDADDDDLVDVTSSWVGFFYRGTKKDDKPCVKLRDTVKEGQQIGSVVTMNVVQKLSSPVTGKLVEVLVEDGQPVEYGQPLLRMRIEAQDTP
ncbi:MAG TPA: biotin/lipoyl-binding protein [Spirochaetota bacterium]|nr:biotin/lipoyl-binding protein [Spirochaetota bacterium]HPN82755.1 biotin/lipoyl-binding protein [Spirochaetota bacterium]